MANQKLSKIEQKRFVYERAVTKAINAMNPNNKCVRFDYVIKNGKTTIFCINQCEHTVGEEYNSVKVRLVIINKRNGCDRCDADKPKLSPKDSLYNKKRREETARAITTHAKALGIEEKIKIVYEKSVCYVIYTNPDNEEIKRDYPSFCACKTIPLSDYNQDRRDKTLSEVEDRAAFLGIESIELYYKDQAGRVKYHCYLHNIDVDMSARNFKDEYSGCVECAKIKRVATNIILFDNENPMQNKDVCAKAQATLIEKNGGIHPFVTGQYRQKALEIFKQKYGVNSNFELPGNREKALANHFSGPRKWTDDEIYKFAEEKGCQIIEIIRGPSLCLMLICKCQKNVDNPRIHRTSMCHFGREGSLCKFCAYTRTHKTMLERYGTTYTGAIPGVLAKIKTTSYSYKDFTCQNGEVIKCRGYEPYAYSKLYEMGYIDDNIIDEYNMIINGIMPKFRYWNNDKQKDCGYYPDLFIISENRFIEVKSTYTYELDRSVIYDKMLSVVDAGYFITLWVFDEKHNLVKEETFPDISN